MVESSLANWDGSKSSANQNVPTPTAIPTTMPASISDSHPHPAISDGPYRENHNQNAHRATGNSSRAGVLHMAIAGSTGGLPHALANSLSTPSASSPALAPKPPPSTPTRITRTDIGLPAPPLHFGAPREILTTPASPHDPPPPWLRQSPSPKNGLIPMDVGMQRPPSHSHSHPHLHSNTRTPPSSSPLSPLSPLSSSPATGRGGPEALGRSASASASPSTSRQPALGGLPATSRSLSSLPVGPTGGSKSATVGRLPTFGAPGAALLPSVSLAPTPAPSQLVHPTPFSTSIGNSAEPARLRTLAPAPEPSQYSARGSNLWEASPLSSLSSSSPASGSGSVSVRGVRTSVPPGAGSWWSVEGGAGGSLYGGTVYGGRGGASEESKKSMAVTANGRGLGSGSGSSTASLHGGEGKRQHQYGKKREVDTSKVASSNSSGRRRSASASANGRRATSERLFIPSPKLAPPQIPSPRTPAEGQQKVDTDPRELFTPEPERLFTPEPARLFTPEPSPPRTTVVSRRPPPPGVGIARPLVRAGSVNSGVSAQGRGRSVSSARRGRLDARGGWTEKAQERKRKRKREILDCVLVPPAPYKRSRVVRARSRSLGAPARERASSNRWRRMRTRSMSRGRNDDSDEESADEEFDENKSKRGRSQGRSTRYRYQEPSESASRSRRRSPSLSLSVSRRQSPGRSRRQTRSYSRSRDRSTPAPPRKIKTKSKGEGDVEGEVHASLGAALNEAWARNERAGTIPVGQKQKKTVRKSVREERGWSPEQGRKREQERDKDRGVREVKRKRDTEVVKEHEGGRSTDKGQHEQKRDVEPPRKRTRKAPMRADAISSQTPKQAARSQVANAVASASGKEKAAAAGRVWCQPEETWTRIRFDVPVAEADRAACTSLALCLYEKVPPGPVVLEREPRPRLLPSLVWPLPNTTDEDDEEAVSMGGMVRGLFESPMDVPIKKTKVNGDVPTTESQSKKQTVQQKALRDVESAFSVGGGEKAKSTVKPRRKPETAGPSKAASTFGHATALQPLAVLEPVPETPTHSLLAPTRPHPFPTSPSSAPAPTPFAHMEDTQLVGEESMPLSAKARGKQRENDSPQRMLVGSEPRTPSANPSRTPSPALDGGAIWMQSRRSTSRGQSISGRSQVTRSPVMSDYFVGLDPSPARGTLQTTPPGAHYYSTAPPTRQLPSPTTLDEQAALPILDTLPSSLDDQQQYGNGTVDPSLLFGGLMEPEVPISLEHEEDARMRSPSPFSSSSSSASASSSVRSAHPPPLRTSGRQPVQRHVPVYMISTDLLHSDDESQSSSSASYASDRPKPIARPKPHPKPKQISTKGPEVKSGETKVNASVPPSVPNADRFFRYSGPPWPPGDNDEVCHQCRSRKRYLTMSFDECSHNYCVRCVMLRYEPDTVPFECFASTQDCPACSETCTCDKCTIRRGQNYASARSKRHSSRTPELRLHTSRVSVASPSSPKLRYPSLEQKVIEPAAYYATMYDLTGAPIARTYTGADGDEGVIVAKRLPKRRVFIGVVQEEWGLGTNPQVFMEPVPVLAKKAPKPGHERYYIGRQSVLSLRVRRRPPPRPVVAAATPVLPTVPPPPAPTAESALNVFPMDLDSDSFGSPLSSLDDTDTDTTGEDVGEEAHGDS